MRFTGYIGEIGHEALPADDAGRAGAIAAAERAIEQAMAQKEAAQAILDENPLQTGTTTPTTEVDSLMEAVAAVKGSNKLAEGYPMMPAAIGKRIAGEVMTAIGTAAPGTNGTIGADTPMGGIMNDADDIGAMTWAMIVGEDNVMDVRRFDTNAISEVKAASVMGSMASGLAATGATVPTDVTPPRTVSRMPTVRVTMPCTRVSTVRCSVRAPIAARTPTAT